VFLLLICSMLEDINGKNHQCSEMNPETLITKSKSNNYYLIQLCILWFYNWTHTQLLFISIFLKRTTSSIFIFLYFFFWRIFLSTGQILHNSPNSKNNDVIKQLNLSIYCTHLYIYIYIYIYITHICNKSLNAKQL